MVNFDWGGRPFTIDRGKGRVKTEFVSYLKQPTGSDFVVNVRNAREKLIESDKRQFDDMIKSIISEAKQEEDLKQMILSQGTGQKE